MEDLINEAVELVAAHHPTLESQRRVLIGMQDLPGFTDGFSGVVDLTADLGTDVDEDEMKVLPRAGLTLSVPLFDPGAETG